MKLDLTSLESAIAQLEEAIFYYNSDLADKDFRLRKHLRAAVIQAFEFSYELSYKMIKRSLKLSLPNPQEIDSMSFDEVIRAASAKGLLLNEVKKWREYRKERGITSHTYDEDKAIEVFDNVPSFLREAKYLLAKLREYN